MEIIRAKIPERIIKNTSSYKYENTANDIEKLQDDILKCYDKKSTVILVGQVQSGKTKFVIDLIYKALYNKRFNFDAIVYFSGNNTVLDEQTLDRLVKEEKVFTNIASTEDLKDSPDTKKIVIVSMKEISNLRIVTDFLASNASKIRKILVVDDESDYGAVNSKSREETYNNKSSPVYKEIYNNMYRMCGDSGGFLKLTATPFVDILTEKDIYKTSEPHLFSIPTRNEYTGVKFFNNINNNFWYPIIKDNNYEPYSMDVAKRDVIDVFFLWIYKSYQLFQDKSVPNFDKSDLLINISNNRKDHSAICKVLGPYVFMKKSWKNEMKEVLNNKFEINLDDKEIEKIYNFYYENLITNNVDLVEYNGKGQSNKSLNKNYNIIVGGKLLSRGKSFENLLCEFIVIKEKSQLTYDSLLQKCRWFGYRGLRAKYMALICNERIKNKLKEVELIINMFHDGGYGHHLNYHEILSALKRHKKLTFDKENYSSAGKIKYAKRTKTIHPRRYW